MRSSGGPGRMAGRGAADSTIQEAHCDLCEAARLTEWFHDDEHCWIADCEICAVPMVVWKQHGVEPPADVRTHMLDALDRIAAERFGADGYRIDAVMRQIPDHFHAHARDPNWWFRRFSRKS